MKHFLTTLFLVLCFSTQAQLLDSIVQLESEVETEMVFQFESQDTDTVWTDTLNVRGYIQGKLIILAAYDRIKDPCVPQGHYVAWALAEEGVMFKVASLTKYKSGLVMVYP